jgi:hypothetical protein
MTDIQQEALGSAIAEVLRCKEAVKTSTYQIWFLEAAEYDLTMAISEIIHKYEKYTSNLVIERAAEVIGGLLVAGLSWPEVTPSENRTLHLEIEGTHTSMFLEIGNTTMNGFIRMGETTEMLPTVQFFDSSRYPKLKAAFEPIVEDTHAVPVQPTQASNAPTT